MKEDTGCHKKFDFVGGCSRFGPKHCQQSPLPYGIISQNITIDLHESAALLIMKTSGLTPFIEDNCLGAYCSCVKADLPGAPYSRNYLEFT